MEHLLLAQIWKRSELDLIQNEFLRACPKQIAQKLTVTMMEVAANEGRLDEWKRKWKDNDR